MIETLLTEDGTGWSLACLGAVCAIVIGAIAIVGILHK